ncbi:MAG: hypothetical protein KGH87_06605 [Thaumarchaeota archaeon]|nr:hypothetical protein [Nitrososphaerota archaeon]
MAVIVGRRRYRGNRYYGDGAYPHQSPNIVLTDTATGTMYRLTAPGGAVTLVSITALAATDVKADVCTVRDSVLTNVWYQLNVTSGSLINSGQTSDRSRPIYYTDTNNVVREFVVTSGTITTVPTTITL